MFSTYVPGRFAVGVLAATAALFFFTSSFGSAPATPSGGTLTGQLKWSGSKPKLEMWKVDKDTRSCSKTKSLDRLVIGKSGGVANAFVIIEGVKGGKGASSIPEKVELDQKQCMFTPHSMVARAGGTLVLANSDDLLHNVHAYNMADRTTLFNVALPIKDQHLPTSVKKPGLYEVVCDAGHTWMSAYVWVGADPYVAVTDADGNFSIQDVPPGTYNVRCWHEGWKVMSTDNKRPNFSAPVDQRQQVTIGGGPASVSFDLHD
jgi:plastocyanin